MPYTFFFCERSWVMKNATRIGVCVLLDRRGLVASVLRVATSVVDSYGVEG